MDSFVDGLIETVNRSPEARKDIIQSIRMLPNVQSGTRDKRSQLVQLVIRRILKKDADVAIRTFSILGDRLNSNETNMWFSEVGHYFKQSTSLVTVKNRLMKYLPGDADYSTNYSFNDHHKKLCDILKLLSEGKQVSGPCEVNLLAHLFVALPSHGLTGLTKAQKIEIDGSVQSKTRI